jgi:hypothetical protein
MVFSAALVTAESAAVSAADSGAPSRASCGDSSSAGGTARSAPVRVRRWLQRAAPCAVVFTCPCACACGVCEAEAAVRRCVICASARVVMGVCAWVVPCAAGACRASVRRVARGPGPRAAPGAAVAGRGYPRRRSAPCLVRCRGRGGIESRRQRALPFLPLRARGAAVQRRAGMRACVPPRVRKSNPSSPHNCPRTAAPSKS